jgi:hypothetical protein
MKTATKGRNDEAGRQRRKPKKQKNKNYTKQRKVNKK